MAEGGPSEDSPTLTSSLRQWPSENMDIMADGSLTCVRSFTVPCYQFGLNAENLNNKFPHIGGPCVLYAAGYAVLMCAPLVCFMVS